MRKTYKVYVPALALRESGNPTVKVTKESNQLLLISPSEFEPWDKQTQKIPGKTRTQELDRARSLRATSGAIAPNGARSLNHVVRDVMAWVRLTFPVPANGGDPNQSG
uniref:(California timema) hypothetical protein n=1 Tax=Timema californicum TaxID=61474 RepID=A0A7R9IYJ5_TIMCA|nr:unnamed protein product [Timema californicum]